VDDSIEMQLNSVSSLKINNSRLEAELTQLAGELQDKEKLVSCEYCFCLVYVY